MWDWDEIKRLFPGRTKASISQAIHNYRQDKKRPPVDFSFNSVETISFRLALEEQKGRQPKDFERVAAMVKTRTAEQCKLFFLQIINKFIAKGIMPDNGLKPDLF